MPSLKTLRHQEVLFTRLFEELTQIRIDEPERPVQIAQKRKRRKQLTSDGRLNIIAADHPARKVVAAGKNPLAMSDRQDLLVRIVRILAADAADGIMATMDLLEELLILHDLVRSVGLPPFLNDKLLLVSLNRGGLAGSSWEMDDPLTGPTPKQCALWKMDGVKMLWRYCHDDAGSLATMKACAAAITDASVAQLPFFLEPLPVVRNNGKFVVQKDAQAMSELIGVASALGESSRYLWLKLPFCRDFATVAQATTLPILLLGGEAGNTSAFLKEIKEGLSSAHNVRGAMIGRNVLYPETEDPVDVAATVHELVHAPRPSAIDSGPD
jgi:DhnA family fructose-bisphosphate aldolase class Ia